jgi:hypothetical protein
MSNFQILVIVASPSHIHHQIAHVIQCKFKKWNTTDLVRYFNLENHCFLIPSRKWLIVIFIISIQPLVWKTFVKTPFKDNFVSFLLLQKGNQIVKKRLYYWEGGDHKQICYFIISWVPFQCILDLFWQTRIHVKAHVDNN